MLHNYYWPRIRKTPEEHFICGQMQVCQDQKREKGCGTKESVLAVLEDVLEDEHFTSWPRLSSSSMPI